jgi:tryptophan-rich sensory protein
MKKYMQPVGIIVILQVFAFLTSYFVTEGAVQGWYQTVHKAALSPPDWLFAPVWVALYTLLGIALWRLWRRRGDARGRRALIVFLLQLAGNYSWSFVFFGMRQFTAAFLLLLAIDLLTMACMLRCWWLDRKVTWLLAPYLAWIGFATYLAFEVMRLN